MWFLLLMICVGCSCFEYVMLELSQELENVILFSAWKPKLIESFVVLLLSHVLHIIISSIQNLILFTKK